MSRMSPNVRGGSRPGAGRPSKWNHYPTKLIRVPKALAKKILAYARDLDRGGGFPTVLIEQVLVSKTDAQLARENKHLREVISLIYAHHEREEILNRMRSRLDVILTGKDESGNFVEFDDRFGSGSGSEGGF